MVEKDSEISTQIEDVNTAEENKEKKCPKFTEWTSKRKRFIEKVI